MATQSMTHHHPQPQRGAHHEETVEEQVATFLRRIEMTVRLPDVLVLDIHGQPFEPVQLGSAQEIEGIPEYIALLLRAEPVGGGTTVIHANRERIVAEALAALHQQLAGSLNGAGGPFLPALQQGLRSVQGTLEQRATTLDADYDHLQESLGAWQERSAPGAASGGLLQGLWTWITGAGGRLTLPQAVSLWNTREQTALTRTAHHAAVRAVGLVLEDVTRLLETLERTRIRVAHIHQAAVQQVPKVQAAAEALAVPWTWRVASATVAEVLARPDVPDHLLAAVLQAASADEATTLPEHLHTLARQEARQRVQDMDILRLIELEASSNPLEGIDPVVAVGQALIERMAQSSPWQLVPQARPRLETLQVTPGGAPVYSLEGLHTAAYGERQDRLAFVQVQMDVALRELRVMEEQEEACHALQQRRNGYVLEELAGGQNGAWSMEHGAWDGQVLHQEPETQQNGKRKPEAWSRQHGNTDDERVSLEPAAIAWS